MKKLTIELSNADYRVLERIAKRILDEMNPIETKSKKWIKRGHYLINTQTGVIIDSYTKKHVYNVQVEDLE